jgi:hypothetical protein
MAEITAVLSGANASAVGADSLNKAYATTTVTTSNGYNPLELGDLQTYDGCGAMVAGQTGFKVTTSIGCTSMSAATMDISLVTLSPEAEQSYLSDPRRTFYYDEVQYVKIDSTPTTEEQSKLLGHTNFYEPTETR